MHVLAFATWTGLLIAAEPFGRLLSRRNIGCSALAASGYFPVCDELSQGIPPIHRTIDPTDILANGTGVGLAAVVALAAARVVPQTRIDS